jgi:ATP-dependent RNA helicase HrpB
VSLHFASTFQKKCFLLVNPLPDTLFSMVTATSHDKSSLPIESVLGQLKAALGNGGSAVLQAPPGAGKTTRVPLALLDEVWLKNRKILMLEPRRLAARAAAYRMADTLGENVGQTVGYRVRLDSRVGPGTRIEVITEGILTRMLQSDPALENVGLVIFDEFHERSLDADLGLSLCLDLQGVLNEGLRLLVMSATIDTDPVAALLGNGPVIQCLGREFPVETRYHGQPGQRPIWDTVADAVRKVVASEEGDVLVFLPGAAEIRRTEKILRQHLSGPQWMVLPLFGNLSRADQDRAIVPAPAGRRKIVLATSIAETSLTIQGIRIVVDSGLMRVPRFDVRSSMTRLETLPVSRASADQRKGRAGRTGPGICYRLWTQGVHGTLTPYNRPEILEADLTALALELAIWGVESPGQLAWLDPPPDAAFKRAEELLADFGALDGHGKITPHGKQVARVPLHPRLAHMIVRAKAEGTGRSACDLAALISERDIIRFASGGFDADLGLRMDVLRDLRKGTRLSNRSFSVDHKAGNRIIRVADTLMRQLSISKHGETNSAVGRLLAWAYPDRIAKRRPDAMGRFHLSNGRGAFFPGPEPLGGEDYLVCADLDGHRQQAKIFRAAAYDEETLLDQYEERVRRVESVDWDPGRKAVKAVETVRLGALILRSEVLLQSDPEKVLAAMVKGIRQTGLEALPWTKTLRQWRTRAHFVGRMFKEDREWPDMSDQGLLDELETWLAPYLSGVTRLRDVTRAKLKEALDARLTWHQRKHLDDLAPTHWVVPSGSRIPIDYSNQPPILAVRLQEMFGATNTPAIAGGRQPLLIHLLSPAGRPVQVTQDLEGFWQNSYIAVKKDMLGRYPKHYWPDDPLRARATNRVKPRREKKGAKG